MSKLEDCSENIKNCLDTISNVLTRHFDIKYCETIDNQSFDLYAYYKANYHKSFLTRSTVYEGFSVFEHILFRVYSNINTVDIEDFKNMLIGLSPTLANPNKMHKKSLITGVMICEDEIDEGFAKLVRNFFYRKTYKFCFHGWSETQIVIYSLKTKTLYLPKTNKNLKKLFVDL